MANDQGARPASPWPPANAANDGQGPTSAPPIFSGANDGVRLGPDEAGFDPVDQNGAAEAEIEAMFGARLLDLRRLPAHEKSGALRAAREWRRMALKALGEKRARERLAQHAIWRSQRQPPRTLG
jgi:hypothetical protein